MAPTLKGKPDLTDVAPYTSRSNDIVEPISSLTATILETSSITAPAHDKRNNH